MTRGEAKVVLLKAFLATRELPSDLAQLVEQLIALGEPRGVSKNRFTSEDR